MTAALTGIDAWGHIALGFLLCLSWTHRERVGAFLLRGVDEMMPREEEEPGCSVVPFRNVRLVDEEPDGAA